MARITAFTPMADDVRWHKTDVECFHRSIEKHGERRLHLASHGSDRRKTSGVSQTFQLDENSARELLRVLIDAFPGLGQPQ